MNLWHTIIEALQSLSSNKMRTGLTMLGMIIGVGAVIAMLAVGSGAEATILGQIEDIGTNLLFIMSDYEDITNPKALTLDDMEALQNSYQTPSVAFVSAATQGNSEVSYMSESKNATVSGITDQYQQMQNLEMAYGQEISAIHIEMNQSVAVLGNNIAEDLFDRTDGIIGEVIRIDGKPFQVIGVLEEKGGSNFGSADEQIYVPISTAQMRLHPRSTRNAVDVIFASATAPETVNSATEEIKIVMRNQHNIAYANDDFQIISQQSFMDMASSITSVLTIFLGGVAGISLLVGGIGIMNIMLVSVVERTREIGLRKALGARRTTILTQFLVESSLISILGGAVGIVLGWIISTLVGLYASSSGVEITPLIGIDAVLLGTLFSAAVGIFFGIYPANRAAGLEPVEALRSE